MITLRDVTAGYPGKSVLHIQDLAFSSGILTLAGENGSGKSTLLRAILGALPHTGTLLVNGQDPRALRPRDRARQIAYLPQDTPAPDMTVRMLAFHGRFSRMGFSHRETAKDREAVARALSVTGMTELADRRLQTLSGGERKRAWLCLVIAQEAPCILLDEPGAGLDVRHELELGQILLSLKELGHTVIVASHDLQLSFAISDEICLLERGTVLAMGSPRELADCPDLLDRGLHLHLVPAGNRESLYPYIPAKPGAKQ
ncbi:MAG: ABC transporter ATP-binding protein [Lachnospiraceae bacterium]